MMGPFLGVTLVPQTEVRNIMIPIFHDMMDWEQRKNGNFKQVFFVARAPLPACACVCFLAWVFHQRADPHLLAERVRRWRQS